MDMNPDEALAAGWLRPGLVAGLLERISRFTVQSADAVVVLDRFMRERVLAKGVAPERVHVIAPWSMDRYAFFDQEGRARFRREHGLTGRFVVMYSGNHSPVHPLDTLIEAAERLRADHRFIFLFVGGGSEFSRLQAIAVAAGLTNVKFLPYQPIESLSASLSAADVQAVVLGSPMVGTIHPSKLYNALAVGSPVLYVGPEQSHVSDALGLLHPAAANGDACPYLRADFHDVEGISNWLVRCQTAWKENGPRTAHPGCEEFSESRLLPQIVRVVEQGR
jgi:glycosyltransferase involved in cell wall biosynthesis